MRVSSSRICPSRSRKYTPFPPRRLLVFISSKSLGPLTYLIPSALIRPKNGVEIFVAHIKGVVMAFKPFPVIKIQGQVVIYLYRGEVPSGTFVSEAKDICEPSS